MRRVSHGCRLSYRWPGTLHNQSLSLRSHTPDWQATDVSQSAVMASCPMSIWHPGKFRSHSTLSFCSTGQRKWGWLADRLIAPCRLWFFSVMPGTLCVDMLQWRLSLCVFLPVGQAHCWRRRAGGGSVWLKRCAEDPKRSHRSALRLPFFGCCVNIGTWMLSQQRLVHVCPPPRRRIHGSVLCHGSLNGKKNKNSLQHFSFCFLDSRKKNKTEKEATFLYWSVLGFTKKKRKRKKGRRG